MSGHSKWSTIKRKKGAADAKRGQLFTKLTREILIAARSGGVDMDMNFQLRLAVQKARDSNMPLGNVERAIQRGGGTSGDSSERFEEVTYEGYASGGAAIFIEAVTDNLNRTVAEIRSTFSKSGGNLGESGSVSWNFETKGIIVAETLDMDQDEVILFAIDNGAEDVDFNEDNIEVRTPVEMLESVRKGLEDFGAIIIKSELSKIPKTILNVETKVAVQILKLLDKFEDLDDVQKVYTNADFSDQALEEYALTI